jgi:MOSC domain-containing protein YiiM
MKILGVNLGREKLLHTGKQTESTGIFKEPVDHPVRVAALGLEADVIVDKKNHGGPDQAVYVYGGADYEWWEKELGRALALGTFGDNLTISDLESATFSIGDRLSVGAVILEVTAPRIPCSTFAARMGDPQFVKKFRAAERPGLYCRVIQEGVLQAGDPVSVEKYTGETITLIEMYRDYYNKDLDEAALRHHLRAPIAIRAREDDEERLARVRARQQG